MKHLFRKTASGSRFCCFYKARNAGESGPPENPKQTALAIVKSIKEQITNDHLKEVSSNINAFLFGLEILGSGTSNQRPEIYLNEFLECLTNLIAHIEKAPENDVIIDFLCKNYDNDRNLSSKILHAFFRYQLAFIIKPDHEESSPGYTEMLTLEINS